MDNMVCAFAISTSLADAEQPIAVNLSLLCRSVLGDPSELAFTETMKQEHGWVPPGDNKHKLLIRNSDLIIHES